MFDQVIRVKAARAVHLAAGPASGQGFGGPISSVDPDAVEKYLRGLQAHICAALEAEDGEKRFIEDSWNRAQGGGGLSRVIEGGGAIEKAGVNFSRVKGKQLPASATARRPELTGRGFEAMGISLIVHPRNPYVPSAHANLRFFVAAGKEAEPVWWFGGGIDLTPFYGFEEDAVHWHRTARTACDPFGPHLYQRFKKWCDDYFFIRHRNEPRGIGGLFFDDFDEGGFDHSFGLLRSVGDHFLPAYLPTLSRRKNTPYGERQRNFQLYRRGRYVEFNLVYDRGTLFGLQSGGRTESFLVSLPPLVRWKYDWHPEPGSEEARLYEVFLQARDWAAEG